MRILAMIQSTATVELATGIARLSAVDELDGEGADYPVAMAALRASVLTDRASCPCDQWSKTDRAAFGYCSVMVRDDEQMWLARIDQALQVVALIDEQTGEGHFDLALPGSELAEDDREIGDPRVSSFVGHCLAVSLDALRGASWMLRDPDTQNIRLPMVAQYPVLRTALEAASLAVWVLARDDRTERLSRLLQAQMDELIADRRLAQTFAEPLPGDSKSEISRKQKIIRDHVKEQKPGRRRLRDAAVRLGLPPEVQARPGFGPLIATIAPQIGPTANQARAVWAYISGISHSSYTRTLSASDIELLSAEPRTQALLTAKPSTVSMALDAAILARIVAMNLTARRGGNDKVRWVPILERPGGSDIHRTPMP